MALITITVHTVAPVTKDTAVVAAAAARSAVNNATCETDATVLVAECSEGGIDSFQAERHAKPNRNTDGEVGLAATPPRSMKRRPGLSNTPPSAK